MCTYATQEQVRWFDALLRKDRKTFLLDLHQSLDDLVAADPEMMFAIDNRAQFPVQGKRRKE